MPQIDLGDKIYHYEVERKPIRTIRLRLKSADSFIISCSRLTPDFIIRQFIHDHQDWLLKNSSKIKPLPRLADFTSLTILDHIYQLTITLSKLDSVVIFEDEHQIYVKSTSLSETHLHQLLNKKLRPLALKLIKQQLVLFSRYHGFKYGKVSVRNQTGRFGSCSFQGNLSFNWQIIFFPFPYFCHVLLHELTHLDIKDHSARFWQQLSLYDPQTLAHKRWLRREGNRYLIIKN